MRSKEFPSAPMERLARRASGKRISKQAVKTLRTFVLERADEIARESAELAKHAGRKTVLRDDILFVNKRRLPI